jgi:hypothetical protein
MICEANGLQNVDIVCGNVEKVMPRLHFETRKIVRVWAPADFGGRQAGWEEVNDFHGPVKRVVMMEKVEKGVQEKKAKFLSPNG